MGAVCCCLCTESFEDYINPNSFLHRNCICLNCFVQNLLNMYTSLFRRNEVNAIPSTNQGVTSVTSTASFDNSLQRPDIYRSPPRPLPFDTDPRFSRDGLVRREKGSSHLHEETIPLRGDGDVDSLSSGEKWNGSSCEDGLKEHHSKACMKLSTKTMDGIGFIYSSSDDEDVCPTCLEEYSSENPKIITKCSHHFHLACIYEWMERSDSCPVCGKVMAFDESDVLT